MNKKAYAGPIAFIFTLLVVIFMWFIWFGRWMADVGQQGIIDGSLTGLEAFFYANLNLWFFIALILGTIGYMYFAGGE